MKNVLILAVMSLISASVASAAPLSTSFAILECYSGGPDFGYRVHITARDGIYKAVLTDETFAGPTFSAKYTVKREQSQLLGAPVYFKGEDFNLEVMVDTAPIPGGHRSLLTAEVKGQ